VGVEAHVNALFTIGATSDPHNFTWGRSHWKSLGWIVVEDGLTAVEEKKSYL
jgi:hypothetical protein